MDGGCVGKRVYFGVLSIFLSGCHDMLWGKGICGESGREVKAFTTRG